MPVKECQENNKSGYKWGDSGKCYTYPQNDEGKKRKAKKSAILQGIAIGEEFTEVGENKKYTGDFDLLPKGHPKSDK